MSYQFILWTVATIAATIGFTYLLLRENLAMVPIGIIGIFCAVALAGSATAGIRSTNDAYAAAEQQGITITVAPWQHTPFATEPCDVELKLKGGGKSAQLILPNSGKVVTQDMLESICDTN